MLLDSTLNSVEVAEQAVLQDAESIGFAGEDLRRVGMAVRERMVNAVVHGNRYKSAAKVHLSISNAANRLTVIIGDEEMTFKPHSRSQ